MSGCHAAQGTRSEDKTGGELRSMNVILRQWTLKARRVARERRNQWLPFAAAALREAGLTDSKKEEER